MPIVCDSRTIGRHTKARQRHCFISNTSNSTQLASERTHCGARHARGASHSGNVPARGRPCAQGSTFLSRQAATPHTHISLSLSLSLSLCHFSLSLKMTKVLERWQVCLLFTVTPTKGHPSRIAIKIAHTFGQNAEIRFRTI